MKKIFIFVFMLALCVSLTACDPGAYCLSFDELTKNVVRIDLIDYNNPDQKGFISWVPDHSDDLLPFDNSKCTLLKQLDDEKSVDFLKNSELLAVWLQRAHHIATEQNFFPNGCQQPHIQEHTHSIRCT